MIIPKVIAHPLFELYLTKIVVFIAILLLTYVANKLVQRSLNLIEKQQEIPYELFFLIRKIIKVAIYLIGLITALEHMDAKVDTILTSLGVGGLAIGFALKDSLTNVISGIIIIAYRPFSIGDYISLKTSNNTTFEGKVIDVNFRYVTIDMDDNRTIIPNSTIVSTPVIVSKKNIQ